MPRHKANVAPTGVLVRDGNDNKPKAKMTGYAFFVQICREEHKRKHPEDVVALADFSKKCSERWKTMTDKEKLRFNQMAEEDKKRYQSEMANYVPPPVTKTPKGKKKKDPNAPKRSMSAFFWYSQTERAKVRAANPSFGVGDVAKELGRRWSEADPPARSKYEALAEKDRERYGLEKRAYQMSLKETKRGGAAAKKKGAQGTAKDPTPSPRVEEEAHRSRNGNDDEDDGDDDS